MQERVFVEDYYLFQGSSVYIIVMIVYVVTSAGIRREI
jgi:hypothetical protein